MKGKLLITTAVLAVMLSAGANAQTRPDDKADKPAAMQNMKERDQRATDANRTKANDADRKDTQTTGQSSTAPKASDSKAETRPGDQKPASAQDNTQPRGNTAQSGQNDKASDKANDKSNAAQQNGAASDRSKQANEPAGSKPNTASQNDARQPSSAQRDSASDRNQATTNSRTEDRNRDAADTRTQSATRISASLQTEQRTRLHQAFTRLDVKPVTQVNFSISVGTAVPRSVRLHRVPSTIIAIVPQYRGYDYFVVRDQVIIVQPRTQKIVDVIERSGPTRAGTTTTTRERRIDLSDKQRSYIRQHATSRRTVTTTGAAAPRTQTIVVGEEVPQSVMIESFPEDVYREVPTVREYRYIRSGTDVYLVDPGSRRVIEVIE